MNRVGATFATLLLVGGVIAVPPAATNAPPTPEKLVEALGSDAYSEREAASEALEKLGAAARPALEAAVKHPNPEVGKRAARLLVGIHRAAESLGKFDVKMVRLSYKKLPLGTAVNDLRARTGIKLTLDGDRIADPLRLVTCETGDLPPWEAVQAFLDAAGLRESCEVELPFPKPERTRRNYVPPPAALPLADAVPITLIDGQAPRAPGSRSSAVRVVALPPSFPKHRLYLGGGSILFHFDVTPMPGYHVQGVTGVRVTKVIDDANRVGSAGTSREPSGFMSEFFDGFAFAVNGGGGVVLWDGDDSPQRPTSFPNPRVVPVPLNVATPGARKLKLLEGAVVCEVNVPDQPLATVENVKGQVGVGVEGLRSTKLTVLEAKPIGKSGILRVQTEQPSPWATSRFNALGAMMFVEEGGGQTPGYRVRGFDAAGKPIRLTNPTNSDNSTDELVQVMVNQYTCPDGIPAKLVFYGPKPVMVEVPFKMENVPLP